MKFQVELFSSEILDEKYDFVAQEKTWNYTYTANYFDKNEHTGYSLFVFMYIWPFQFCHFLLLLSACDF